MDDETNVATIWSHFEVGMISLLAKKTRSAADAGTKPLTVRTLCDSGYGRVPR